MPLGAAEPTERPTDTEPAGRPPAFGKADPPFVTAAKRLNWGRRLSGWLLRRFPIERAMKYLEALDTTLTLGRKATPRDVMSLVDRLSKMERFERQRPELVPQRPPAPRPPAPRPPAPNDGPQPRVYRGWRRAMAS
jgi:hypothetical protein